MEINNDQPKSLHTIKTKTLATFYFLKLYIFIRSFDFTKSSREKLQHHFH